MHIYIEIYFADLSITTVISFRIKKCVLKQSLCVRNQSLQAAGMHVSNIIDVMQYYVSPCATFARAPSMLLRELLRKYPCKYIGSESRTFGIAKVCVDVNAIFVSAFNFIYK